MHLYCQFLNFLYQSIVYKRKLPNFVTAIKRLKMNVHKTWILLLFLLIPTILFAQKTRTVKGKVCTASDTQKGEEPLPYASIVILGGKDSTFIKGAASDTDGHFNLQFYYSERNTISTQSFLYGHAICLPKTGWQCFNH